MTMKQQGPLSTKIFKVDTQRFVDSQPRNLKGYSISLIMVQPGSWICFDKADMWFLSPKEQKETTVHGFHGQTQT